MDFEVDRPPPADSPPEDFDHHGKGNGKYCKRKMSVGEKFRTSPSKTFRMDFIFVPEETIERSANHEGENLVWTLVSYIFQLYESYEIKFSI